MKDNDTGDFSHSVTKREAIRPFQTYIVRALLEGSPGMDVMFDEMVEVSEQWLAIVDKDRQDAPFADRRSPRPCSTRWRSACH